MVILYDDGVYLPSGADGMLGSVVEANTSQVVSNYSGSHRINSNTNYHIIFQLIYFRRNWLLRWL